jgi:site-specific recombinase XerD
MQIPTNRIAFSDCTRHAVLGYLDWLSAERGCSTTSINQRLMILRSFFKYAGEIDCAYTAFGLDVASVPARKARGRVVEFLSEQALKVLLAQPDTRKRIEHRNQFFMILMYDTAARCGEILNLKLRDLRIDDKNPVVYLHGKGDKMRIVPLLPETVEHSQRYIHSFHGKLPYDRNEFVFYTITRNARMQMSADTVALFMKKYRESAIKKCSDMPEHLHPHMLRHTRAMHLYRQGMPIHLLSEYLGHVNYETTKIYAYADTEMKRLAVAKADILRDGMPPPVPLWTNDEETIRILSGLR